MNPRAGKLCVALRIRNFFVVGGLVPVVCLALGLPEHPRIDRIVLARPNAQIVLREEASEHAHYCSAAGDTKVLLSNERETLAARDRREESFRLALGLAVRNACCIGGDYIL
eukprot:7389962-Prymnesium_polylepis.1